MLNIDQQVITEPIRGVSSILQQTEALRAPVSLVRTLYFTMSGITVYYDPLNSVVKKFHILAFCVAIPYNPEDEYRPF
jgi:hypothetical protein